MPGLYEYTISMNDKASGTLQKLTGSSYEAVQKFIQLDDKTSALKNHIADFGNGIGALKQKIDILQGEKELIDSSNLTQIRQYNKEIASLNQQITKLETDTGGSKLGKNLKDAFSQIPGAGLLTNPLVMAGAGVAAVGKLSVSWEEGMAKINATAQLPQDQLDALGSKIKKLGMDAGADLSKVPDAYEKIISQTGDVKLSTDILATSLKGARAGFTDVDVVAGAVGQSLSAIGDKNTKAADVMDTLFAAKRVGAGEFADFANSIPGLIAAGKNIGITWQEVSGAFAYMTGKGNSAADSTMYLQNAFSALGKSEIVGGLKKAGVEVYNAEGKMRGLADIMTDLSQLTKQMNDQQKSTFFEKIGLVDQQAKGAFSILTNETSKLQEAMKATGNATGELELALDNTNNPANRIKDSWAKIQGIGLTMGGVVTTVLNPVLTVLGGLLSGVAWIVNSVGIAWAWWNSMIQQGNPWITGLTVLLAGLAAILAINWAWSQKDAIMTSINTAVKWVHATATATVTGATWSQVAAQWGLNTALLASPITWIVLGIGALVAGFAAAWKHSEKFRAAMYGVWEVLKGVGVIIKDFIIDRIKGIFSGLGSLASAFQKLVKLDFSGAKEDAVKGFSDLSGVSAVKNVINSGKELGGKFKAGYAEGLADFREDKAKKDKPKGLDIPQIQMPGADQPDMAPTNIDDLLAKLDKTKKKGDKKGKKSTGVDKELSLGLPQDYNQTGSYAAITQQFGSQVDLAFQGKEKPENPTEKPVINMATRVDEIAGSLKKVAAGLAIPLALGTGQAAAMQPLDVPDFGTGANANVQTTRALSVPDQQNTLYNAFDNSTTNALTNNSLTNVTNNDLSRKVENINNLANSEENNLLANNSYDNSTISTSEVTNNNNRTDARSHVSTVNNTDQGKNIRIDRFTDKIEIHIHTSDAEAGKEVAQNVRDEVEKALAEILNV